MPQQALWSARPDQKTRWKSRCLWNGTQQWQRHHGQRTTGESVQLQIFGCDPVKRWQLQRRGLQTDCHSSDDHAMFKLYPSFSTSVKRGHSWLRQEKGSRRWRTDTWGCPSAYSTGSTKPTSLYRFRAKVSWVARNLYSPLLIVRNDMSWPRHTAW